MVMKSIKEDAQIQCESIVKALELGQKATEDTQNIKGQYMLELKRVKEKFDDQVNLIKKLKKEIRRIEASQNFDTEYPVI